MKLNNFRVDLNYSHDKNDDQLLNSFYQDTFPNLKEIKTIKDLKLQKKGVDKIITLKNGKEIKIEEKKRRKDYGDILLEEWSVFRNNKGEKKGWTGDPEKITDFIVYIIMPKIYLIPYDLLQLAWRKNYFKWFKRYGRKKALNSDYETTNIAVPTNVLMEAIKEVMFFGNIKTLIDENFNLNIKSMFPVNLITRATKKQNRKKDRLTPEFSTFQDHNFGINKQLEFKEVA